MKTKYVDKLTKRKLGPNSAVGQTAECPECGEPVDRETLALWCASCGTTKREELSEILFSNGLKWAVIWMFRQMISQMGDWGVKRELERLAREE